MHPVIPRVRVGDVLLGTKNLRNWLHTSALLVYVRRLSGQKTYSMENGLPSISKKDRFVVAVNAWETFGVWSLENDIILLFINPTKVPFDSGGPRMSPDLFARWFIRTKERRPDLREWPDHAYHLWASLQMNGLGGHGDCRLNYMTTSPGREGPFILSRQNPGNRSFAEGVLRRGIPSGITRQKTRKRHPSGGRGYGPVLEDIPKLQQEIQSMTKNPRVSEQIPPLPYFMFNQ